MPNTHATLSSLFSDIANAIRAKTGKSGQIIADNFPSEIAQIETGIDTSDATLTANDALSGVTGYAKGEKVTGNIPRNNAISTVLDANTTSQAIPTGYYGTAGSVSIVPQTKTVTPSGSAQDVTPDSGKVFSKVSVGAVTQSSGIGKTCYDNGYSAGVAATKKGDAVASDVRSGKTFTNSSGVENVGTLTDRGAWTTTVNPP